MNKEKQILELMKNKEFVKLVSIIENTQPFYVETIALSVYKHYQRNYRKINENKVVISKEEYRKLKLKRNNAMARETARKVCEHIENDNKKIRKETAEAILALIVPDCKSCDENWHNGCLCLRASISEKIAKEFGVDLGE